MSINANSQAHFLTPDTSSSCLNPLYGGFSLLKEERVPEGTVENEALPIDVIECQRMSINVNRCQSSRNVFAGAAASGFAEMQDAPGEVTGIGAFDPAVEPLQHVVDIVLAAEGDDFGIAVFQVLADAGVVGA